MPLEQGSRLDDAVNRITKLWHSRGMKGLETKRESTEEKILNVTLQKMNIEILIGSIRRRTEDGSHPMLDAVNDESILRLEGLEEKCSKKLETLRTELSELKAEHQSLLEKSQSRTTNAGSGTQ